MTDQSRESRPDLQEQKRQDYHPPELVPYGNLRELTRTTPTAIGTDAFDEATTAPDTFDA